MAPAPMALPTWKPGKDRTVGRAVGVKTEIAADRIAEHVELGAERHADDDRAAVDTWKRQRSRTGGAGKRRGD